MSSIGRGTVLQQLDRLFSEGTLAGLGDRQLLERYLTRRDQAAFEALVEVHGPMVLGLCRRFLRDPRDIEDAFQATFLVLVRKAAGIRDGSLLSNWLYGVALRVATRARANLLRRRGREQAIGDAEFAARPESPDALGLGPVLDQELSRLPAKYRAPLVLCYLRGQTHDQAADELKCPVGTVRSRMARGRDLLKRRLTQRGCAPSAALFGAGTEVPAHLLTEVVPARLVAATVDGALAIGSSHTIQAVAVTAPVLALTQGVVASMKFAQLKWIGLALLATGLSAGGAVVVGAVAAQNAAGAGGSAVSAGASTGPSQDSTAASGRASGPGTKASKTTEQRLRGLEEQIDRIYRLSGFQAEFQAENDIPGPSPPPNASTLDRLEAKLASLLSRHGVQGGAARSVNSAPNSTASGTSTSSTIGKNAVLSVGTTSPSSQTTGGATRSSSATLAREIEPRTSNEGSNARIRELETQLRLESKHSIRMNQLHEQKAVSDEGVDEARGKVALTIATLQGMADDFTDELERAKLGVKKKKAELDEALAQKEVAASVVRTRINQRHQGGLSAEELSQGEATLHSSEAHVRVKEVELEEAILQERKLERWRTRIQQILQSAGATPAG